jgi:glycerol-3-phosphate dehydrogenase
LRSHDVVRGVVARDEETGRELPLEAKVVLNATGPFSDSVRRLDEPEAEPLIRPSQGVHIVLGRRFLPGDSAIMVPHTDDGRVLFAIPWQGRVLVGTTDTPVSEVTFEPRPRMEEVDFLLEHAARYLTEDPSREDVLSAFAGIRPLVGASPEGETASVSRDHCVHLSRSGLLTIAGGKWTTYRKMAEDAVEQAVLVAGLEERPSVTASLEIHGHDREAGRFGTLSRYGADAPAVGDVVREREEYRAKLHPALDVLSGEVIWAARREMARTVEDVLSRRTRSLLLDARSSIEAAPRVASLLARELGRSEDWEREQVKAFETLARSYLPF